MFVVILSIGMGSLVYGFYTLSVRLKLIPMSKIITGTVIGLHETSLKRGTAYYPLVKYHDPVTNIEENFDHNVGNGRSKYNVGDKVELRYYNGKDRKLVLINTWPGKWGIPTAYIIAGVVFIAFGLLMNLS